MRSRYFVTSSVAVSLRLRIACWMSVIVASSTWNAPPRYGAAATGSGPADAVSACVSVATCPTGKGSVTSLLHAGTSNKQGARYLARLHFENDSCIIGSFAKVFRCRASSAHGDAIDGALASPWN